MGSDTEICLRTIRQLLRNQPIISPVSNRSVRITGREYDKRSEKECCEHSKTHDIEF